MEKIFPKDTWNKDWCEESGLTPRTDRNWASTDNQFYMLL